jgi:hypothetical protein
VRAADLLVQYVRQGQGLPYNNSNSNKVTATMTTPWDRISDEAYKQWLLERQITAEEYNTASLVDRSALRTQFDDTLSPPQPSGKLGSLLFLYSCIQMLLGIRK